MKGNLGVGRQQIKQMLGMPSDGFNPLSVLNPISQDFYDAAARIADALIESEGGSGQYWTVSAQRLLAARITWEEVGVDHEG